MQDNKTPILLLIFNRPEYSTDLIDSIRECQPTSLYIAADGPRNPEEKELTDQARVLLESTIDWPCSIHKLYRDTNLGLRRAVSQAISWFFEHVEKGIILEDDCRPGAEFFNFINTSLDKFDGDNSIGHISGNNLLPEKTPGTHLSKYPRVWGWATWKLAWNDLYDDSDDFLDKLTADQLKRMYPRAIDRAFWTLIVQKMRLEHGTMRHRSWAYFWALNLRYAKCLCVQPNQNLLQNIGFGTGATNTINSTRLEELSKPGTMATTGLVTDPYDLSYNAHADNRFVDNILIDSKIKYLKTLLKALFPFLKPFR